MWPGVVRSLLGHRMAYLEVFEVQWYALVIGHLFERCCVRVFLLVAMKFRQAAGVRAIAIALPYKYK